MDITQITTFLAENPGATAQEIGVTPVEMIRIEEQENSPIVRVGLRKTGKRGRPPVEWAVAGTPAEEPVAGIVVTPAAEAEATRSGLSPRICAALMADGLKVPMRERVDMIGYTSAESKALNVLRTALPTIDED